LQADSFFDYSSSKLKVILKEVGSFVQLIMVLEDTCLVEQSSFHFNVTVEDFAIDY